METKSKRTHADFQDNYRRSSNFYNTVKHEHFDIEGDGELSLDQKTKKEMEDEKRIEDVMKSLDENS
ncbi:MAG: hypothetical protein CL868_15460 [Cytophagaceae bacterium]|nr:hypothetical protein [Cytophagaceae bacterium]|tara:strand:+ start:3561 stop:3761 length:201 start_codon:yes stop_codon:yes gene_type:complete